MPDSIKPEEIINNALKDPNLPKLYFNGFLTGHSNSDMLLLLLQNGIPSSAVNMSFTTAKSLYLELGKLISQFEASTNHTIMTVNDVESFMKNS